MNYRHAYHAGNFADVLKHAVLALCIGLLQRKPAPIRVIDTHAGAGRYRLDGDAAQRTGEHRDGIARVLAATEVPAELEPYLRVVRIGWPQSYPGSPRLARALLRVTDRLTAAELHPDDAAALAVEFRGDAQADIRAADGWTALRALLPPPERRGLVLIDPPFEQPDELQRLAAALKGAHRRWATGVYLAWYPVKAPAAAAGFHDALQASGIRRIAAVELLVRAPRMPDRLNGCGMVLINPPFGLMPALDAILPFLGRILAQGGGAAARAEWLVPE